ncbi:carbamoyltransferase [bacterium]|nr:carbamoyltransferase [bacterium]
MYILGISCFYHDAAAALIQDGRLVAVAEEERLSRRKHDSRFPVHAAKWCMDQAKIGIGDVDYVVFYEKPFTKFERILKTNLATFPRSARLFSRSMATWMGDKLWMEAIIRESLGYEGEILYVEHHVSHAASAFFCSPFDEAAILSIDGVGEWTTTATGVGRGNEIRLDQELRFPHSLGLLYSAFTAFLGFEVNEGEYKVMGMAPYGKPNYVDRVKKLVRIHDDGSFWLNLDYFAFHRTPDTSYSRKFVELFGPPRDPRAEETLDPYYADVAASIQSVTEEILITLASSLRKKTGMTNLCMAGGVALNSVANAKIRFRAGFEDVYIQPAAGDPGGALGAALYAYRALLGGTEKYRMDHAYHGPAYTVGEAKAFFDRENIPYTEFSSPNGEILDRATDMLQKGSVIGWYQGKSEWGPRALGNRSIIADPRRAEMKDVVNRKIKFREPFRPFAPSVLVDRAEDYFELPNPERHYPARFMLYVVPVKNRAMDLLPAITHVDGSGRLQTVYEEYNPRYYDLIHRFGSATGVYSVLNTSFNLKGEPIVCTPADAYGTFSRSGMDALIVENLMVEKK